MKWIKNRDSFLSEAKIGDVLLPKQKEAVIRNWGEQYLNFEEIEPTTNIKQGKWKLSEEDKIKALSIFFSANLNKVYEFFGTLPDQFVKIVQESIDFNLLKDDKWIKILNNFDLKKPTINQISVLSENIFRKISISETKAEEIMIRDETGRPVMGEDKKPLKRKREEGEIIFSKNLVNINSLVEDFNNLYPDKKVDEYKFRSGEVLKVIDASKSDFGGDNYLVEVDIYGKDLFLRIDHNPKDILNMSVSRFYGSCQHLYRGGYKDQLIGNVFDPNSIPAFLVFDSPILDRDGVLISEQLPLSRMIIRNILGFDSSEKPKIFFDRAYPDRMKDFFDEMVEEYSGNTQTSSERETYIFAPDIPLEIRTPYMDRLSVEEKKFIGINSRALTISQNSDWSNVIISPKAKIEEITIETNLIPDNFFSLKLDPKWIKLKYIKINNLKLFENLKSSHWGFEKCIFKGEVLNSVAQQNPDIKSLQFVNCEITNLDLSIFKNLEELHIVYTIDDIEQMENVIKNLKLKKLVISGDLASGKENKKYINSIKSKGVKVETIGPVI